MHDQNNFKSELKKIYLDTNQLFYIRRIGEEAEGWDFGSYEWAQRKFPRDPGLVDDIRALCYIVALQYEWDLDFSSSDASYSEVCQMRNERARATRDAWLLFCESLKAEQRLRRVPFLPRWPVSGPFSLAFIEDPDDRVILRHFATDGADVLFTCDKGILKHKTRLAEKNLAVMRPSEWLSVFFPPLRGDEDSVTSLERVLFGLS